MKRRWNNDLEKPEAACNGTHPTEKNAKISFTCRFHNKNGKQKLAVFIFAILLYCLRNYLKQTNPIIHSINSREISFVF